MEPLFPSIPSEPENTNSQEEFAPVFESVEYKIEQILEKIKNIDMLDEQDIKHIIIRQHDMILNYDLFLANERRYALELFTNERFLQILLAIIGTIELSTHEIICINKLTYDYYVSKDKDGVISNLLLDLSHVINNKKAIILSGIYGIQGGRLLAMISRSTFNTERNIKRVNKFIVKSNIALSVKDIVNTYCILYDHMMDPIIYTLLETRPSGLTTIENDRFTAISKAIMILLNAMTSDDIYKVITNYVFILKLNDVSETRFSLRDTCKRSKLDRISAIIRRVEFETEDIPACL